MKGPRPGAGGSGYGRSGLSEGGNTSAGVEGGEVGRAWGQGGQGSACQASGPNGVSASAARLARGSAAAQCRDRDGARRRPADTGRGLAGPAAGLWWAGRRQRLPWPPGRQRHLVQVLQPAATGASPPSTCPPHPGRGCRAAWAARCRGCAPGCAAEAGQARARGSPRRERQWRRAAERRRAPRRPLPGSCAISSGWGGSSQR